MEEVASNLIKEKIQKERQYSKVVIIPKPGKNHKSTKEWRPINLINNIGTLAEKAVADVLQGCGLLRKNQFRLGKGRSANKGAQRTVT